MYLCGNILTTFIEFQCIYVKIITIKITYRQRIQKQIKFENCLFVK